MSDDIKETDETPTATAAHWAKVIRDIREHLDELEAEAKGLGIKDTLSGALRGYFDDWAEVEKLAMGGNRMAIELLCRHRQRSAGPFATGHAQGVKDAQDAFERLLGSGS